MAINIDDLKFYGFNRKESPCGNYWWVFNNGDIFISFNYSRFDRLDTLPQWYMQYGMSVEGGVYAITLELLNSYDVNLDDVIAIANSETDAECKLMCLDMLIYGCPNEWVKPDYGSLHLYSDDSAYRWLELAKDFPSIRTHDERMMFDSSYQEYYNSLNYGIGLIDYLKGALNGRYVTKSWGESK